MGAGTYIYPAIRGFLSLTGGTVTGDTIFTAGLSASTIYTPTIQPSQIAFSHPVTSGLTGNSALSYFPGIGGGYANIGNIYVGYLGSTFGIDMGNFGNSQIFSSNNRIRFDRISGNGYQAFDINGQEVVRHTYSGVSFYHANDSTALIDIRSASTSIASLRIRSGVTVSAPNDGDFWNDGTHLYGKIGGAVKQIDNDGATFLNPLQVGYGNSSSGLTGTSALLYSDVGGYFNMNASLLVGRLTSTNYGMQAIGGATLALYGGAASSIFLNTDTTITANSSEFSNTGGFRSSYLSATTVSANTFNLYGENSFFNFRHGGLLAGADSGGFYITRSDSPTASQTLQGFAWYYGGAQYPQRFYSTYSNFSTASRGVNSISSVVNIAGSAADQASLQIGSGITVSSPSDGDIWNDGNHLYGKFGGVTRQLDNDNGSGTTFLTPTQIGFGNSFSSLTGSSYFTLAQDVSNSTLNISSPSLYGTIDLGHPSNPVRIEGSADMYISSRNDSTSRIILRPAFIETMRLAPNITTFSQDILLSSTTSPTFSIFSPPAGNTIQQLVFKEGDGASEYARLLRFNSSYISAYGGTSLATQNSLYLEANSTHLVFRGGYGTYNLTDGIANSYSTKLDTSGFRIDRQANIHSANTVPFQVGSSLGSSLCGVTWDGTSLRAYNRSYYDNGRGPIVVNDGNGVEFGFGFSPSLTTYMYFPFNGGIYIHGYGAYGTYFETGNVTIPNKLLVGGSGFESNGTALTDCDLQVDGVTKTYSLTATTITATTIISNTITATTLSAATIQSDTLIGTTERMVQADTGGTLYAVQEIVSGVVTDPTAITLLTTSSNWDSDGVYTGTTITNTYQGQFYGDTGNTYVYLALADNYFARIPRV